jgi:hypothetical protein
LRKLWRFVLDTGRVLNRKPGLLLRTFLIALEKARILSTLAPTFNRVMYLRANTLSLETWECLEIPDVELLIVSAPKDFTLLRDSICSAIQSQKSINISKVNLVVPDNTQDAALSACGIMNLPLQIYPESKFIPLNEFNTLKEEFQSRTGWVIQQLIKLRFSASSESKALLVIDSDTCLLKSRVWLNESDEQILLVSEENSPEYHDFLKYVGLEPNTAYTFITHHMLYQPAQVREMLKATDMVSPGDQLSKILNYPGKRTNSPFSLDYELYGQWMLSRNVVRLAKWGNVERERGNTNNFSILNEEENRLARKWGSVSLHSWRN